jgi:hypothetical protein
MMRTFSLSRVSLRSILILAALVVSVAVTALKSIPPAQSAEADAGQLIFRFDTFGDEQLWTDKLRLHEVIQAVVDPMTALAVGLKVDASALPADFFSTHSLNDPATTVELIRLNAVLGVVGTVDSSDGRLTRVGITCALCHSSVDNSAGPGIGQRLDGWPNRDLDPGRIIALSPALTAEQKAVYNSWGPGFYDPRFNIDGINSPVLIPPAFGLQGVGFEIYTGDGPISYWNNYVAVTQMGGHGSFCDKRIKVCITQEPDLVTPKLPALLRYQLSLTTPSPPAGSFDPVAALRGRALFEGKAACDVCHMAPTFTDVDIGKHLPTLHKPKEVGQDPTYAKRSATKLYRTTPLRALLQHPPYFHDGSAATLMDVVKHYDDLFKLDLSKAERDDLVEYLKNL